MADGSLQVGDLSLAAQEALKGNAGPAGPASASGPVGPPGAAGTSVLWAVVNANGTLARGTTGVSSSAPVASAYKVDFPRDVTWCSYVATIGGAGVISPGSGQISVHSQPLDANGVAVVTYNDTGTLTNKSFHLAVYC